MPKGKKSGAPSGLVAISGWMPSVSATSAPGTITETQAATATARVSLIGRKSRQVAMAVALPANPIASALTGNAVSPPAPNSSDCNASTPE